jgi:pimeloyl-ACP methyl ester carboxylesterase
MPHVDTPLLRVAYEDHQPDAQRTVILLHGWPDGPRTWRGVVPHLLRAGYRVIVPALRGFSPTRFLSPETPRTGQLVALGRDLLDFIAALGVQQPVVVGHDWGARAVATAVGLSPDAVSHMVMLSTGYGTNDPSQALNMTQARLYWYHWFMATPRGQAMVAADRRAFAREMWLTWAPEGWFDEDEFTATAAAWDNDDWLPITLHSYQHRWGHAPGDPAYVPDEARLQPTPQVHVPSLVLHGDADGVSTLATSAGREVFFTGRYERHILSGVGHFPQREAPEVVAQAVLRFIQA